VVPFPAGAKNIFFFRSVLNGCEANLASWLMDAVVVGGSFPEVKVKRPEPLTSAEDRNH